jgi:dolichyl-phosphate beta-glucosyltransferase
MNKSPAKPDDEPEVTPELTIVIPAYNESRRLAGTLERIGAYAAARRQHPEVIIVDDGSRDRTSDVVRTFARENAVAARWSGAEVDAERFATDHFDLRLLADSFNRGKGYAVRRGVLAARGASILMCDADLSTPLEELPKLQAWLERGYRVVIGSRDLPDSILDPPQPRTRRLMAWTFRAIRRRVLLPGIRDTQCGFKLFGGKAAAEIFSRQTMDGWVFDCEVLGLADRLGYRIKEVGIEWHNHPHSRVRPLRDMFHAVADLWRIRRCLGRLPTRLD